MQLIILLFECFIILTSFYVVSFIFKYFKLRKIIGCVPGPKNYPFIGSFWQYMKVPREDRFNWFTNLCFKYYKGMVVLWMGMEPLIAIRKPRQIEIILRSSTLISKGIMYRLLTPWLGNGLITSTGVKWLNHRRLITPSFHFGVLEEYAVVMQEKVQILIECIQNQFETNSKEPIDIFKLVKKCTLDIICETAMGVDIDSQRKQKNTYVEALLKFAILTNNRYLRPWFKWNFIYYRTTDGKESLNAIESMNNFIKEIIIQKETNRKQKRLADEEEIFGFNEFGIRKRKAFLDILLDARENDTNALSFQEVLEEVHTFMFAGYETSAAAISWTLFTLGNYPEIQAKVHKELEDIFGKDDEPSTIKELCQLKYLDLVIKEVHRLYPSVPTIGRCMDHDVVIDNCFLPKGTFVNIHIYHLHHDPEVWEDPDTFNPDRFLLENSSERNPYAYIPFSAGARNCIGQKFATLEIKFILTAILRKWRVSSVLKPSEIKFINNFMLCPHNDKIELYLTPFE